MGGEITASMVGAGELALSKYDPQMDSLTEGAVRIFLAMMRAKRR